VNISRRLGSAAVVFVCVATGAASASSISASARTGHASASTCLNGGTVKKTLWTPAPNGAQRGQIAQFGHLQAGQSVAMTDTAVNGKNQCIANVQIYLAPQEQAGVTR
jgi:hypothetical protein